MDMMKIRCFVVFVTFLFGFAVCSPRGSRKITQDFINNAAASNLIDEETAEQVWIHCRTELLEITNGIEDFDSYFSDGKKDNYSSNTTESDLTLLARRKIQEAIVNLPPDIRQTLLDCVRTKCFAVKDYEETEPNTWLIIYRQLIFFWSRLSRRTLLGKDLPHKPLPTASDEALRPFTVTIHATVADAPGPSQKSAAKSPAPSKSGPASSSSPSPSNPPRRLPDPPLPVSNLPLPFGTTALLTPSKLANVPPASTGNTGPSNSVHYKNLLFALIAVSCVAILLFIALILMCFVTRNDQKEKDPTTGARDHEPVSNMGSVDTSPGSSLLSTGIGHRSSKNGFRLPVAPNNITTTNLEAQQSTVPESELPGSSMIDPIGGGRIGGSGLPPPPGKAAASPPSASSVGRGSAPPPPPPKVLGPKPPPPPKGSSNLMPTPPRPGIPAGPTPPAPIPHLAGNTSEGPKTKLKPFFWDKVLANPAHSMVWHHLTGGSFQVNEEKIESLFGVSAAEKNKMDRKKGAVTFEPQSHIRILDPKKAQNLAILLKALNVTTEEVCDAIKEGHELPLELVQTLLKMAPTSDEELKLRLFTGDLTRLGPAEQFLKVLVDIPYAFKRLESLYLMGYLQEEVSSLKESFATLEVACKELTKSRLFLKLLEAVLKTGNRMNAGTYRGGAHAFKLDTLLKLSDVKGTDGETTLLHFVVQEIIRSEGIRAARRAKEDPAIQAEVPPDHCTEEEALDYYRNLGLTVVSGLSNELANVKKAAIIDINVLTSSVSNLGHSLAKSKEFLHGEMKTVVEDTKFRETLTSFVQNAEEDVMWLLEEETRMTAQIRSTTDYFHGQAGRDEGLHLFVIVRDFLIILDKVCKEVKTTTMVATTQNPMKDMPSSTSSSSESRQRLKSSHRLVFPTIKEQDENDDFTSSDDETS